MLGAYIDRFISRLIMTSIKVFICQHSFLRENSNSRLNRRLHVNTCFILICYFLPTDCDHHIMNLGFLVDGSATVELSGAGNFNKSLEFVANLIKSFDVSENATSPGMVVFSQDPHLTFSFSEYKNSAEATAAAKTASYPNLGRKSGKALNFVRPNLFTESATKDSKPNYLIILTSGVSYDLVKTPSKLLRKENVTIFGIGVGRDYDVDELKLITGDSGTRVYTTSFADLGNLNKRLKKEICQCKLLVYIFFTTS